MDGDNFLADLARKVAIAIDMRMRTPPMVGVHAFEMMWLCEPS